MAKSSGLASELFVGGFQLSGDIQQVGNISSPVAALDVTGIDKSAFERILGLRDGAMSITTFFNTAAGQAHPALSTLPTDDVHLMYMHKTTLGNPAAMMVAKQVNYDGTRATDAGFTFAVEAQANSFGLEWGNILTAGVRSDTGATNGTSFDFGADQAGNFDAQGYLQVLSFTGTDATVKIQTSTDNGGADPFADRISFPQVTTAPFTRRTTMTSPGSQVMERYARVVTTTTGGFTEMSFVVAVAINASTISF